MTEYRLTYTLTPDLLNRAMTAWTKPQRTRRQKLGNFALGFGIYVVAVALSVMLLRWGIISKPVLFSAAGGFAVGIALWAVYFSRSVKRIGKFAQDAMLRHGSTDALFCADHVDLSTKLTTSRMDWLCIDEILRLPDAAVLRCGAVVYAVPDTALPEDVTQDAFCADLNRWMEAAR